MLNKKHLHFSKLQVSTVKMCCEWERVVMEKVAITSTVGFLIHLSRVKQLREDIMGAFLPTHT